jgi:hypothetical protein
MELALEPHVGTLAANRGISTISNAVVLACRWTWGDMRPPNLFNKSRRKKRRIGNFNAYKRQAVAEYEQAREKLLLGSSGAGSP